MAEYLMDLQPEGDQNSAFHTLDAYPGQEERSDVYDYGSSLKAQMNLVDVIHGTIDESPTSLQATLIIADFKFISRDPSRRFRHTNIDFRFRENYDDDVSPPEVSDIAPLGVFDLNPTEQTEEIKYGAKADVGAGLVVNTSAGLEWSLTKSQEKRFSAKLTGVLTKEDRLTEPMNLASWSMQESKNKSDDRGIPSLLRTAVLLKRKNNEKFYGGIKVYAKVSVMERWNLQTRKGKGDIDPVLFNPKRTRTTPVPNYINPKRLGSIKLAELMAIQSITSVKEAPHIEQNTVTEGIIPSLTLEKVMGIVQTPESNPQQALDAPGTASETLPPVSGFGELSSLEETMHLLLHAVRKGVEVLAEANRVSLDAWPEVPLRKNKTNKLQKDDKQTTQAEK